MLGSLLLITAANTLIMGIYRSRALALYKMQLPKSLTLCWHCVDALLTLCWRSFWGVAVSTNTILPIKAANTSIMGKCRSTALGLYKINTRNRWRSVDAHFQTGDVTMSQSLLLITAAITLIIDNSEQIASQLTYLQDQQLLMLHWHSFSECGCYLLALSFSYKGCRYIDYG